MRQLTHLRDGRKVAEYLLDLPDVVVGRGRSAHIRLDGNTVVSRQHAVVRVSGDKGHVVEDLGGANGTWVDGRRVQTHALRPGERIVLGTDVLRYDFGHRDAISLRASAGLAPVGDDDSEEIEEIAAADVEVVQAPGVSGAVGAVGAVGSAARPRGGHAIEDGASERTAVANKDELNRLLELMAIKAKPHLQALGDGDDAASPDAGTLVALKQPPVLIGHTDACGLRLPGGRWLLPGKVAGRLVVESSRWQVVPESPFWNPIRVGGDVVRRIRMLEDGDVLAAGGRRFVFRRGEGR